MKIDWYVDSRQAGSSRIFMHSFQEKQTGFMQCNTLIIIFLHKKSMLAQAAMMAGKNNRFLIHKYQMPMSPTT
ncbi:MAG: hypothetical protein R3B47_12110 [Bacteroidia bacterium]